MVTVAGDPVPEWVTGVENVHLDKQVNRFDDAEANIRAGLAHRDEDWAYIFHDDMIVTRPVDWIAPSNRGLLSSYKGGGAYSQRAKKTAAWLRGQGIAMPVNFNIHLPFLVHVADYLWVVELASSVPAGFGISVYGNILELKTRKVIDPKVSHPGQRPHPSWPVWSLSDRSFKTGLVGRMVRDLFPTPGPYEK